MSDALQTPFDTVENAEQYGLLIRYCGGLGVGSGTIISRLVFTLIRNLKPGAAEDAFRLQARRLSTRSPSSLQWGTGKRQERKRAEQDAIAYALVEQHPRMSDVRLSVALRGLGISHSRRRVLFWRKDE